MPEIISPLMGSSAEIARVSKGIEKLARSSQNVALFGETGVGLESIARLLHENSDRSRYQLISIDSRQNQTFSEVSAMIKGATQGTCMIQNAEELAGDVRTSMGEAAQQAQVRLIGLFSADTDEVPSGYGVAFESMYIPALCERREDISEIATWMIERLNRVTGNTVQPLSKEVQMALNAYDWPENLKELENVLERLVIMKEKGAIELADLPNRIFQKYAEVHSQGSGAVSAVEFPRMVLPKEGIDLKSVLTELENHLVDQALARTHGNKNKASTLLGLNRTTLVEKLRKRGMIVPAKTKRPGMSSDELDAMMK